MTATQTRIRRGTNAQVVAGTPASSELWHNTTNNRIHVGDGTTLGGHILPTAADIRNQSFTYVTAGGTANAITFTPSNPPSAYAAGHGYDFLASATNTGATTVNVNSLGTKDIQKISGGTLSALSAGDIVSGGIYTIIYDGTRFILINPSTYESTGGGGLELLEVAAPSAVGTVDFNAPDSTYDDYLIKLTGITLNILASELRMRLTTTSLHTGSLDYVNNYTTFGNSTTPAENHYMQRLSSAVVAFAAPGGKIGGFIHISARSGSYITWNGSAVLLSSAATSAFRTDFAGGLFASTSQLTAIRILTDSSTITSGDIRLYGLRKTL